MNLIKKYKNYLNFLTFQHLGIVAILIQFIFQYDFFQIPKTGLDNSWALSINLALKEKLNFGTDFIFTYGPLGYLMTSLSIYSSSIAIIIFKLFIISNGIYFVCYVEKKIEQNIFKILFYLIVIYFNLLFIDKYSGLLFFFYFLFHLLCYINCQNKISLFLFSIFVGITFYIKVNTGIVLSILYILNVFYLYINKLISRNNILISLSCIFSIHIVVNSIYRINIFSYLKHSFEIINFYNDGMVITAPFVVTLIAFIILISFIPFYLFILSDLKKNKHEIFLVLNICVFLFIVFKQSFVRADLGHYTVFFYIVIYLLIIIYVFSKSLLIRNYAKKILPIVILFCTAMPLFKVESKTYLTDFISKILYNTSDSLPYNERVLPFEIVKKVGNKSIDVIPSEISWIYFNNFKYNPRPIVQSYSAYSKKLINLNYNKYLSNSAPDFVLYHNRGFIDRHFPLWEDPLIHLAVLQHYKISDTIMMNSDSLILFKKKDKIASFRRNLVLDTLIELNKIFELPKTNKILFLECDLKYSFLGKVRRNLFQNSVLVFQTKVENDSVFYSYNSVLPILNSGIIVNKFVNIYETNSGTNSNFNDLFNFFNSFGQNNLNINQIKLLGNEKYYVNKFRAKFWELSFE